MKRALKLIAALPFAMSALAGASPAQETFPAKPITMIIGYGPGSSSDLTGRIISERLSALLGQPVIIDTKGGSGVLAASALATSKPDGYTLAYLDTDLWAVRPHIDKLPYDIFKDVTPIAFMITAVTGLTARNELPFNTVPELVKYAKENPGKLTFASAGTGGYTHLLGEALKMSTGIDLVHVPYKGSSPALTDHLGGRVDLNFDSRPVERVKSGQVKGIAIMSKKRVGSLPDLPTIFEFYPDYPIGDSGWGVFAPAGTPATVLTKIENALKTVYDDPSFQEKLTTLGFNVSWTPSESFRNQMKVENDRWGDVLKTIKLN